jgi:hypothetical protein
MNLLSALRKIRACEGEAAAQLVLEHLIAEHVAAELEACVKVCVAAMDSYSKGNFPEASGACCSLAMQIRERNKT